ncbi:MAG: hypothetical protein MUE83_03970 [Tabrizicola sp.]|jgi:hypothetical protein|nr:hypothetical protein [Tabrizicola sp.]
MTSLIAVITGDLIGSTRQPVERIERAMQAIAAASDEIAAWQIPIRPTRFTRFRGDGWQILLTQAQLALRASVVIQGRLMAMGMESRAFIGVGKAESYGSGNLADASGEAFELSGRGLDALGDAGKLGIGKKDIRPEDQIIADLLSERMGRWTAAQAEAASLQLASPSKVPTLLEIGQRLNISPQAVNDRVRGAGCHTIASVLRRWETLKVQQGWESGNG